MKMHKFPTTSDAYDDTQCGVTYEDGSQIEVKNGDLLLIDAEKVVGVTDTWPFAVTVAHGQLHSLEIGAAVPVELRKKYGPHILRAIGQAILREWPVRKEFLALLPPIKKYQRCSCCGSSFSGRQWSNQDDEFGVCNNCIDDCTSEGDWLEPGCAHGIPGIHYDVTGAHFRSKAGA